ncbi:MAG: hypothetical protein WC405_18880 [Syntrophales bacterium]
MLRKIVCLLVCLFCCGAVFGLEKYNVCVNEVKIDVAGVSGEASAKIQKGVIAYFRSNPNFNLIALKTQKSPLAEITDNNAELLEAAKEAGVDLLITVEIKGKNEIEAALEDLFDERNPNTIMIRTIDLAHGGEPKELSVSVKNKNNLKKALADLLLKYDYPYKKGAVIKARETKVAIGLGEKDGVREGQTVTFYSNLEKEKLAESVILKVGKEVSLSEAEGVKEGDLAEVFIDKSVEVMSDGNINDSPKLEKLSTGSAQAQKGSLSAGIEIGWPFYGLNLTYWPGAHGIGVNYYQSTSSDSSQITHLSFKYYYLIRNDVYFSIGAGSYTDTRSFRYWAGSGYETYSYSYDEFITGVFFGIKPNDYFTFEFGYGNKTSKSGYSSGMVTIATGVHFTII